MTTRRDAATGDTATATGESATATGESATATGESATATDDTATATGETTTTTDTRAVLHRLATRPPNASRHAAAERLLSDAESALSTVESANSFATSGGFARVRTLVDRTDDPTHRERGETVLSRLATIRRVIGFDPVPIRKSGDSVRFSSPGEKDCST